MKKLKFFLIFFFLILTILSNAQIINQTNYFPKIQKELLLSVFPLKSNSRVPFGYLAATTYMGIMVATEITREDLWPSLPLGILGTSFFLFSVPYIANGYQYFYVNKNDYQSIKFRATTSWVLYFSDLFIASTLVMLGVLEITPPPGMISVVGILGTASILFMTGALHLGLKSFKSYSQHTSYFQPNINFGFKYGDYATMANMRFTF